MKMMEKIYSSTQCRRGHGRAFIPLMLLVLGLLCPFYVSAQTHSLWVGESYKCDAASMVMGLTSDVSWSTNGGYLRLTGSGFYRNVEVYQYFSGTATVKCTWKYRLYSGDRWRDQSVSWSIRCNDNPVSISPETLALSVGETAYVSYSHAVNNQYLSYADAYFNSTNPNVVTVSNSGLVTAKGPGTAYINVYSKVSSESPYCTVTVSQLDPEGVSLPESLVLEEGESRTLRPTVRPAGAATSFTWESDDESVAVVNSSGTVTAVKAGTAMVKVTTTVGGFSDVCEVTVKEPPVPPTEISLPESFTIYRGFSKTLTAEFAPENAETYCSWKSDDNSVATVDASGKVTARKEGTATITATTRNGLEAECTVTVSELPSDMDEGTILDRIVSLGTLIDMTFNRVY